MLTVLSCRDCSLNVSTLRLPTPPEQSAVSDAVVVLYSPAARLFPSEFEDALLSELPHVIAHVPERLLEMVRQLLRADVLLVLGPDERDVQNAVRQRVDELHPDVLPVESAHD